MSTSASVASRPSEKASGIRIATPFDGPSPGSEPMMVPMKQPPTASISVDSVSATAKPCARLA